MEAGSRAPREWRQEKGGGKETRPAVCGSLPVIGLGDTCQLTLMRRAAVTVSITLIKVLIAETIIQNTAQCTQKSTRTRSKVE